MWRASFVGQANKAKRQKDGREMESYAALAATDAEITGVYLEEMVRVEARDAGTKERAIINLVERYPLTESFIRRYAGRRAKSIDSMMFRRVRQAFREFLLEKAVAAAAEADRKAERARKLEMEEHEDEGTIGPLEAEALELGARFQVVAERLEHKIQAAKERTRT